ncbi:MAG: hypothetical protein WKF45_03400 [Ilumatobacteraceae bacterium]
MPEDVEQRLAGVLGMAVRLGEVARHDARAELPRAGVGDGVRRRPRRQQPEEVRLARTVRAEHGHALAEEHFEVEWRHEPRELELLAGEHPLASPAALQTHADALVLWSCLGRTGVEKPPEPRLRRAVAARHVGVVRRLLLQHVDERLELLVLLVPAAS